ncbi:MAG: hypothetical protein WCB68_14640, partial [Pyrinomonadaceae bacterium]
MWIQQWLPNIRDFFQILFFIIISTITILTYLKAKKTLLQPLRTEIFKEQLKTFSDILGLFTGKGEVELSEDLGFKELLDVNVCALFDEYISFFFEVEIDESKRPYNTHNCPQSLISVHSSNLIVDNEHLISPANKEGLSKPDPRTKAA